MFPEGEGRQRGGEPRRCLIACIIWSLRTFVNGFFLKLSRGNQGRRRPWEREPSRNALSSYAERRDSCRSQRSNSPAGSGWLR